MPTKTWFATNTTLSPQQEMSETSPGSDATSSPNTGWVVSTGATLHSEFRAAIERASSTFVDTVPPDGTIQTTLGDCLRSTNQYTGDFASADWNVHFAVIAVTNGGSQDGRMRCRLFRGANADGSGATEITAAQQQGGLVTNLTTSTQQVSTATFNPGAFSVSNEYVFVQLAWQRTGAGGMTSADVIMRIGDTATRVISSDFTEGTVLKTASDSPSIAMSEGATGVQAGLSASDSPTISLGDASAVTALLAISDNPTLTISDLAGLVAALDASETLTVSMGELVTLLGFLAVQDDAGVGVSDVIVALLVLLTVSDAPTAGLTDLAAIQVDFTGTDTLAISIAATAAIVVGLTAADDLATGLAEATSLLGSLSVTDPLAVSLVESAALLAFINATDVLVAVLGEAATVDILGALARAVGVDEATVALLKTSLLTVAQQRSVGTVAVQHRDSATASI